MLLMHMKKCEKIEIKPISVVVGDINFLTEKNVSTEMNKYDIVLKGIIKIENLMI